MKITKNGRLVFVENPEGNRFIFKYKTSVLYGGEENSPIVENNYLLCRCHPSCILKIYNNVSKGTAISATKFWYIAYDDDLESDPKWGEYAL